MYVIFLLCIGIKNTLRILFLKTVKYTRKLHCLDNN